MVHHPWVLVPESSSLINGLECAAFPIWHAYLHFLPIETGREDGGRGRRGEKREGRPRKAVVHPGLTSGWSWYMART